MENIKIVSFVKDDRGILGEFFFPLYVLLMVL